MVDLTFWTPALAQVSYEFGCVCLSVGLFVCSQYKISKMAYQFFLIFCMKLGSHKIRKTMKPYFWEKVQVNQESLGCLKNDPKNEVLGGFDKNVIHSCALFFFEYESANDLLTFCKKLMSGKI